VQAHGQDGGAKCGIDTEFGRTWVWLGRGLRSGMTFGPRVSAARGGGDGRGPAVGPRQGGLLGADKRGARRAELANSGGLAELCMMGRQNRKRKKEGKEKGF
jgi:hypothetical protein